MEFCQIDSICVMAEICRDLLEIQGFAISGKQVEYDIEGDFKCLPSQKKISQILKAVANGRVL